MHASVLYDAIDQGDLTSVEKWIKENNSSTNNIKFDGITPLNYAICRNQIAICQYFIKEKIALEINNEEDAAIAPGCAPLHVAAQKGLLDIVIALLIAEVDKEKKDLQQLTAIEHALINIQFHTFAYLLEQDCEIRGTHQNSLLHRSIEIVNAGAPLSFYCRQGNYVFQRKIVERLIQKAPDLLKIQNAENKSPLEQAVHYLNDRQKHKYYTDHLCDLVALLIYYDKQEKIEWSISNFKKILDNTLQGKCAVDTQDLQDNIQKILKQLIRYHSLIQRFAKPLKTKDPQKAIQNVFTFLIKILFSFNQDVLSSIEQIALFSKSVAQESRVIGIGSLPNELIDRIVFYVIEDVRKEPSAYKVDAFEFWHNTYNTSDNLALTSQGALRCTAVSLWREFLPRVQTLIKSVHHPPLDSTQLSNLDAEKESCTHSFSA